MSFISLNILKIRTNIWILILTSFVMITCGKDDTNIDLDIAVDDLVVDDLESENTVPDLIDTIDLPKRSGSRPITTTGIPHVQIGVAPVPEVNEELFRRVFSIPGIENRPSVIGGWRGLWLTDEVKVHRPNALISGREFGHIHDDGSLHIFLESSRSIEAVNKCWAIMHPFALQGLKGWTGFVMLYTPQSFEELNVTFQLIVDGYNYVTDQNLLATDYY